MQVDCHINLPLLLKGLEVDDAHRTIVVGIAITATVGNIQFAMHNSQFIGLIAHRHLVHNLHGQRIHLINSSHFGILAHIHRSHIGTNIGKSTIKGKVSTVGDVYLRYFLASIGICHLHLIGAVDDHPQFGAIYLDIIANITQFLNLVRIAFRVDVAMINDVFTIIARQIQEIEGSLVAAHIALVEQVESHDIALLCLTACILRLR